MLEPVPGFFNTGVGTNGVLLEDGAVDPHYVLVTNAHNASSKDAIVEDTTVWPIVAGPWLLPNDRSKWIGPQRDPNGAGGDYAYRATFDLTGFDPATVVLQGSWATDNVGMDILVNGAATGLQNSAQFSVLTPFVINTGFRPGINTIDFLVNNAGAEANPVGIRVQDLRAGGVRAIVQAPSITIVKNGDKVVLSWPASAAGFNLFGTPSLAPASWTRVNDSVVVNSGQNTVTVSATGPSRIFRLQQ